MSIESELQEIKGAKEFYIPEEIEAWARSHPNSDLHASLEWDDAKAGFQYRLWQVRRLISLHITYEDGSRRTVSLTQDRTQPGGGYREIDEVLRSKALHEIMLADALRELERMQEKYNAITALVPVWVEAEKVRRRRKAA